MLYFVFVCDFFVFFFFFFKQKTAYEMRISDWSSDVCSSDLIAAGRDSWQALAVGWDRGGDQRGDANTPRFLRRARGPRRSCATWTQAGPLRPRSEEHTSELQSLMRISYAVFCLKKKKLDTEIQPQLDHQ